ncbi:hypothetical protein KEM55_008029, partial [Ascosphaera atra]
RDNAGSGKMFKSTVREGAARECRKLTTHPLGRPNLVNKFAKLKIDWSARQEMKKALSGWMKNADGSFSQEEDIEDSFYRAHPHLAPLRNKPFPYEEKLNQLLHGQMATGFDARTIDEILREMRGGRRAVRAAEGEEEDEGAPPKRRKVATPGSARKQHSAAQASESLADQCLAIGDSLGKSFAAAMASSEDIHERASKLFIKEKGYICPAMWAASETIKVSSVLTILTRDADEARSYVFTKESGCSMEVRKAVFLSFLVKHGLMTEEERDIERWGSDLPPSH